MYVYIYIHIILYNMYVYVYAYVYIYIYTDKIPDSSKNSHPMKYHTTDVMPPVPQVNVVF